ncbi:MAG: DoxX family membrane protein [Candidatus Cyclobacteriaceae bacterium M3_2C_046]
MQNLKFTNTQLLLLIALRVGIGWHFLYEGVVKLSQDNWSSQSYLLDSRGLLASVFQMVSSHDLLVNVLDTINIWALILIGFSLMLGLFARWGTIAGIGLLVIYYLSHPAWPGFDYAAPSEGNYLLVNKNLIEILALAVIMVFPTSHRIGLDRFFQSRPKSEIQEKVLQPA